MKRKGLLFIMSAPSGAGKTSICKELLKGSKDLCQSISYTTRDMRSDERDGVDYHFVSCETFDQMVVAGEFAEWAKVHDNCYGTARRTLELACEKCTDVLLDIDFQGAAQLRDSGLDGVFIFVLPPDMAELRRRLIGRDSDNAVVIERRLQNASGEINQAANFDYLVVNDDLRRAVETVKSIMCAETARTQRMLTTLPEEFGLK